MQSNRSGNTMRWLAIAAAGGIVLAGGAAQVTTANFSTFQPRGATEGSLQLANAPDRATNALLASQRSDNTGASHDVGPEWVDDLNIAGSNSPPPPLMETLQPQGHQRQPLLAEIGQANLGCWVMPLSGQEGMLSADDCQSGFNAAFLAASVPYRSGPVADAAISSSQQTAEFNPGEDPIGSLIQSLDSPAPAHVVSFDPPPVLVLRISAPAPVDSVVAEWMSGSCTGNCAAAVPGSDAKPLTTALIDSRGMQHGGTRGSSEGSQTADGSNGSGGSGSTGSGDGSGGGGTGGTGSGSGGTGGTGSGGTGSTGGNGSTGGTGTGDGSSSGSGDGGDGSNGGHGHGHGHSGS